MDGTKLFGFNDAVSYPDEPMIYDCYALNVVDDDEVFCYFYDDFRVYSVRELVIEPLQQSSTISGAKGLLVHGRNIALLGSYHDKTVRISDADSDHVVTAQLVTNDGRAMYPDEWVVRGWRLFVLSDMTIWSWTLD